MRSSLPIRLSLALAGFLACIGWAVVPHGFEAGQLLAAHDDPVRLSNMALAKSFDARAASREIEAALASGDADLAQSFVELARDQGVVVAPALVARVDAAVADAASFRRTASNFVRGFFTGVPDDVSSFAGMAAGDLFVFGDVRDAVREGANAARGEKFDGLLLGLSAAGIAITAGTYFSLGAAAPARVGVSVVKAAGKTGRITPRLLRALRVEKTEGLVRA